MTGTTLTNKKSTFEADTNPDIPVDGDPADDNDQIRQSVVIDFGAVDVGTGKFTRRRVSAADPLPTKALLYDASGNAIATATTTPGASDNGLVTRSFTYSEETTVYPPGTLTAIGQTVTRALGRNNSIKFSISGTYSLFGMTFELSNNNGANYFVTQAARVDSNVIETISGTISNTSRMWELSCDSCTHFQVRCTAYGSGTANIQISGSVSPVEPVPAIATHAVTQSGTWSTRTQDGSGNAIASSVVNPAEAVRGLNVRNLDAAHAYGSGSARFVNGTLPQGYWFASSRITGVGSTTTSVVVTVDPTTVARRGDLLVQIGGTFAQGQYQWGVIDAVSAGAITIQSPGFGIAPTNGLTVFIYRPRALTLNSSGQLETTVNNVVSTTPISGNKTFWESGSEPFGSIASSLTTFYTNGSKGYLIVVANTTDVELGYSLDSGTSEHFIPADSTVSWNLMDIGGDMDAGTDIQVYYPAAAPTRGRFGFSLAYF